MCNKLHVSIHYMSTVVGVVNKLNCRRVWLTDLPWQNFVVWNLGQNSGRKYTLISGSAGISIQTSVKQVERSFHAKAI